MKLINFSLIIPFLLGMLLISCDKDSDNLLDDNKSADSNPLVDNVKLYPTKMISYIDGKESNTEIFEYDENHNLIKWVVNKDNYHTYEYDDKGRLSKEKDYVFNQFITYSVFTYGANGTLVKEENYGNDDKLKSYYLYESNDKRLISSETQFTIKDVKVLRFEYQYDDLNNLLKSKYLWANENGVLNAKSYDLYQFKYDDKNSIYKWVPTVNRTRTFVNNRVEENWKNILDGETYTHTKKYSFKYNDYNFPMSIIDDNGDLTMKTKIEYMIIE